MTEKEIINLVLDHMHQKGALILRHKGKYYPLSWKEYSVGYADDYQDGKIFINACCKRLPDVCDVSIQEFNRSWWLVRSKEQTLGKEENTMSKPDVIIGLVAMPQKATQIVKVIADPKAKVVVVKFTDGATEVVHCSKDDEFDVYVGVAIAEARHKYGTTSRFHKVVDEVLTIVKPKAKKKAKPVPMGPIAPGQEPVRRPRKPRTTNNNKKGSK